MHFLFECELFEQRRYIKVICEHFELYDDDDDEGLTPKLVSVYFSFSRLLAKVTHLI